MVPGTSYTVVSGTGACASAPSASFSNAATATSPAVPTVSTTPAGCGVDGSSTITNYNAAYTYTFTPAGPVAGAGGAITGMVTGTNYTVEAVDGGCPSGPSASFTNGAQLPAPVGAVAGSLTYCQGGNTTLTASGGVSYIWVSAAPPAIIGATPSVTVTQGTYAVEVTGANGCKDTVISTVTELTSIAVTITGALNYCAGSNTTLTASGAATYIWSDAGNSTTPSINVLAGSYTVTGTDGNGCTGTANATVVENALPTVTITGALSYCAGANTTLTANGATAYVWNDAGNSTTPAITVTQGSYTVTGTDGNGCTATANATVTENPLPAAAISGSLTYCTGGNTTLTASGGVGYLWSNGQTTAAVTVTQGTYTVTVADANSCTATTSATVTESTSLTVNITGALSYCPGANTTITATGGAGYVWSDGSNTAAITVTQGTYSVTASDITGCTGTATATVTETVAPVVNITGTLTYCPGTNTTLTANGAAGYVWNDPTNSTTASVTVTQGTYTVTGTDGTGCTATATATVTENAAPAVTISGLLTYCTGGNTTLTASGGVVYLWSGGETTASVTVTQGTYSVTATDATGCTGSTTVNVTESSTLAVSITGTLTYCPGASTTITATGGTSYTWNTGATTDAIIATAGVYTVTATDASCSGTASANVTQTVVAPLALADVTACDDSTAVVNAGSGFVSYLWSTGETTPTISTQVGGVYSVTVEDANGCSSSGSANVTFESCVVEKFSMFVPNAFSPNGDGNNEKFQCFASGVVFADIKVFNRWGEKVFDTNNMFDGWDGTNKGEQCKPGVFTYSINVISADGKSNKYKGTITLIR
ncbi:MAG TPA: gliding motility-associated C-terminal domain-containing protein, partial [Chitinophagales bacterium]|nr:gliding motility-associated C-terminal domain-containing protein [Chitinophagales bacterium]